MMYKLLCERDSFNYGNARRRLEEQVQEHLRKGWKLHGYTTVTCESMPGTSYCIYSQAMIFDGDTSNTPVTSLDDSSHNSGSSATPKVEKEPSDTFEYELPEVHHKVKEATAQNLTKLQEQLRSTTETVQSIIKGVQETVREIRESPLNQLHVNSKDSNSENPNR